MDKPPGVPSPQSPKSSMRPRLNSFFWLTVILALTLGFLWFNQDNVARDGKAVSALLAAGWRVLVIWECALRGTGRLGEVELLDGAANFITTQRRRHREIRGRSSVDNAGSTSPGPTRFASPIRRAAANGISRARRLPARWPAAV